jgi:O-antigen ligase
MLGPVLFLTLGLAAERPGVSWKIAGAAASSAILLCVMLAQARGMWLGIALGGAVAIALGARHSARRGLAMRWLAVLSLGALIVAIGLTVMLFKVLPGSGRDVDMQRRIVSSQEAKARLYYWRASIDMAAQKPLFGQGYAMFDPLFWDYTLEHHKQPDGVYYYDMLLAVNGSTPGHPHNEYLEVLAEEGWFGLGALAALLGFFLFFGCWAVLGQPTQRRALHGAALYGALVAIMVDAFFGFPWRLPASLVVFAVVLAGLYDLIYPQDEDAIAKPQLQ